MIFYAKQRFKHRLEELAEVYHYYYQQADFSVPVNMKQVYHSIDNCQAEGQQLVKQTLQALEDQQAETICCYHQTKQQIEEQLELTKKIERNKRDERNRRK